MKHLVYMRNEVDANHSAMIARISHMISDQNENHYHYAQFYWEMCDFWIIIMVMMGKVGIVEWGQCLGVVEDDEVLRCCVFESNVLWRIHFMKFILWVIMNCFLLVCFSFSYVLTMIIFVLSMIQWFYYVYYLVWQLCNIVILIFYLYCVNFYCVSSCM